MKTVALLCAVVALAACSDADAPAEEAVAVAEPAYELEPGTYEFERSDGTNGIHTLTADGKFSSAVSGGTIETGTWAQEGGLGCLTPDDGEKRCWTLTQPDTEGNITGTMPDGVTVTIRKIA